MGPDRRTLTVLAAVAVLAVGVALPALAQQTHAVDVQDDRFAPPTIEITAGDTVRWSQSGSNPHTVTAADGSFDSHPDCQTFADAAGGDCMGTGDTFAQTFPEPGEYAYFCRLHGTSGGAGMAGTVVVAAAEEQPADDGDTPTDDAPADDDAADDDAAGDEATTQEDTAEEAAADDTELAETGMPVAALVLAGLALLALGGLAVRRRSA